jgi:hypothetical protein
LKFFKVKLKPDVFGDGQINRTGIGESFDLNGLAFRQARISKSERARR